MAIHRQPGECPDKASLVLLYALESLFKLRDQRSFAGLETIASHDAPEKIAARMMCIVHGHQIFGGSARHENDDISVGGLVHECQITPLLNGVLHGTDCLPIFGK